MSTDTTTNPVFAEFKRAGVSARDFLWVLARPYLWHHDWTGEQIAEGRALIVAGELARKALPIDVVRHVLWHFGDTNLGMEPGHFVSRLLVLASSADPENLAKLAAQWPEYIEAWLAVSRKPWGLDWLRGIAKAELDRAEQGLDFTAVGS